jgi:CBS domain-containing protein
MRITEVLAAKTSAGSRAEVVTVRPEATVRELLAVLAEHNIGALVVSADGASVDGIVSERDVVRRMQQDETLWDSPVTTIMSADVHSCRGQDSVEAVMALMTTRRIRHVPVVSGGAGVGSVSLGDVVKSRMSQLEFERDQLDSYVHSGQS